MNQTVEPRAIAVVRSRLPYTDRRSLSQAWFSALHLAANEPVPPRARAAVPAASQAEGGARASGPVARRTASPLGVARAVARGMRAAPRSPVAVAPGATRAAVTDRARCAPDQPPARSYPPFRTSVTLGAAGERVQLLLRREGPVLHVVALCRPEVEMLVRRALTLAAAHVRLRGDLLRASVRTLGEAAS